MPYGTVYGLIPVHGTHAEFPLTNSRVHYRVVDVQYHATLRQTYTSRALTPREVRYTLPLPSDSSVCSYKAVIDGNRTITGVVKGKQQAKAEYDQAVQAGQTATLLEQMNEEVFQISLGNIHPGQTIEVQTAFVALISQDGGLDSLRLTFPSTIGPRYGNPPPVLRSNNPFLSKSSSSSGTSGLELSVAFEMSSPIRLIKSPSHPISTNLGTSQVNSSESESAEYDPTRAFVQLALSDWLTDDIVLDIQCADLDRPRCTVESFSPEEGAEEWTDAYALTLVPRFDLPPLPKQEFIFLVDRSGSMSGGKIAAVKASLQIMLKSLPTRSTLFNIWSFGTNSSAFWSVSRPYTAQTVEEASAHVDSMTANFGGTEIQAAIERSLESRNTDYRSGEAVPTSLFVLTDGESWNLEGVFAAVRERAAGPKDKGTLRVFALGIGNAVSTAMCEGIARAGRGVAVFVRESENPDKKLMGLVRAARGAPIQDLTIDWGIELQDDSTPLLIAKKADPLVDDFEVLDMPSSKSNVPTPPISLFNTAFDPTKRGADTEVGIKDIVLPPLPALQVAPALPSLPSLYTTFRTSIFAIVKRPPSGETPSKEVIIKGTILGRAVELVVPVGQANNRQALAPEDTSIGTPTSRKMIHVLAARALIRKFEDAGGKGTAHRTMTAEDGAEVKRLALRYGLASSQTSFVAIDSESKLPAAVFSSIRQEEQEPAAIEARLDMGDARRRLSMAMFSKGALRRATYSPPAPPPPPPVRALVPQPTGFAPFPLPSPPPPPPLKPVGMTYSIRPSSPDSDMLDSLCSSPSSSTDEEAEFDEPRRRRLCLSPLSVETSRTSPSFSQTQPTVELFARLQAFDGSFNAADWLVSVWKTNAMPPLPPSLSSTSLLSGEQKGSVWLTLLCVGYLEAHFSEEKDVWEMMAEKAMGFIHDALNGIGVEEFMADARQLMSG